MTGPAQTFLPDRVFAIGDDILVRRLDTRGVFPDRPHFGAALDRLRPGAALDLSPLDALHVPPALPDPLLILHMTRCGSTALSRIATCITGVGMVSEAPAIADLLRLDGLGDDRRCDALRRLLGAILSGFPDLQARPVLRLPSWAVWHLPLLRRAFPAARTVFVVRDPIEVAVSQLGSPSAWLAAGWLPAAAGLPEVAGFAGMPAAERGRMVAAILAAWLDRAAETHRTGDGIIDHGHLIAAAPDDILSVLGLPPARDAEAAAIAAERRLSSKSDHPTPFRDDRDEKQSAADGGLRSAITAITLPAWRRFQTMTGMPQ
ncbi:hypothetical protein P7L75_04860 (plasmid) [Tistrella mobilis]|uniref:hypothetical protein n=1 Tax=Tistrella mobilis TaxID=171437 RepID=UPI0035562D79